MKQIVALYKKELFFGALAFLLIVIVALWLVSLIPSNHLTY